MILVGYSGVNKFISLLLIISLAIEVLALINPLFVQYVTDKVISSSDFSNLYIIAIAFFILTLMQGFTEYIRGTMLVYIANNLTEQISANVIKHLLKLPLSFFEKRHKGDIQSKFQAVEHLQKKIGADFINTVLNGLMIIINIMVMAIYSLKLTGIVFFTLILFLLIRYISYSFLKKQTELSVHEHARANSLFLETIQAMMPIKSFLKEHIRFNLWKNSYVDALNADVKIARINVAYTVANQLLFYFEHIVVVCIGALLVLSHEFSAGMLIAFLSYRLLLVNKASSFIQSIFDYRLISIQLERLSDILFQQPEVINSGYGLKDQVKGALTLNKINFQYNENEKLILNNINLQIFPGEKIAIIGQSGCGKSTLLKVMAGLLNKTGGDIYIDNIPIDQFGLKNYREITASVMQDDALLSGSISDNISFYDEHIDYERLYSSAKLACIHDTIEKLPMRYETLIGEMGSRLSGGQKQRLLLARALYKQPKILFLDEATSHLDVENEKKINESLRTLAITQVIIAHRKETIQMADKIINLDDINHKL